MSFLDFYSKQLSSSKDQIKKQSTNSNIKESIKRIIPPISNKILPQFLTHSSQSNSSSEKAGLRSYEHMFRSLNQIKQTPNNTTTNLQQIIPQYKTISSISQIDVISKIMQPSAYQLTQTYNPIEFGLMYVLQFNNNFDSQICTSIINDFNTHQKQRTVPSKMNYQIYAQCIHNQSRSTKVIDKSVLDEEKRQYTVQRVDAQINTEQYDNVNKNYNHSNDISKEQINEKDKSKSIQKPIEKFIQKDQSSILYQPKKHKQQLSQLQQLRLQIQNQKSRIPRSQDYLEIMENKLMSFLKYVVESEEGKKLKGSNQQKIKSVLEQIQIYKWRKIDGQPILTQLQFFFVEIKQLKNHKNQIDKNHNIRQNDGIKYKTQQKHKQRQKQRDNILIEQRPPQLKDLSKQIHQNQKQLQKQKQKPKQKPKSTKIANEKTITKKVEPKKQEFRKPPVPRQGMSSKNLKNVNQLSAIKTVQDDEDSWINYNLNF